MFKLHLRSVNLLLIFLSIVLFISCQKESDLSSTTKNAQPAKVTNTNGLLVFPSFTDVKQASKSLIKDEQLPFLENLRTPNTVLSEFEELLDNEKTTLQDAFSFLDNNPTLHVTADSTVETITEDPILSSLINEKGVFQVGDTLYHFSREFLRRMPFDLERDDLTSTIENALQYERTNVQARVFVTPIGQSLNADLENTANYRDGCGNTCYDYYSSKKRLKGKLWKVNFWFVKAAGAYSKSQRKKWFWWVGKRTNYIEVGVNPVGYPSMYKDKNNAKSVYLFTSFSFWAGTGDEQVPDLSTPLNGYHKMKYKEQNAQCSTCR